MKKLLTLTLLTFLVACGGGGGETELQFAGPAPETPDNTDAPSTPEDILNLGIEVDVNEAYLQRTWEVERYLGRGYEEDSGAQTFTITFEEGGNLGETLSFPPLNSAGGVIKYQKYPLELPTPGVDNDCIEIFTNAIEGESVYSGDGNFDNTVDILNSQFSFQAGGDYAIADITQSLTARWEIINTGFHPLLSIHNTSDRSYVCCEKTADSCAAAGFPGTARHRENFHNWIIVAATENAFAMESMEWLGGPQAYLVFRAQ